MIRMKKPVKPEEHEWEKWCYYDMEDYDGDSIKELYEHFPDGFVDVDYAGSYTASRIKTPNPKREENFKAKLDKYLKDVEKYEKWQKDNEELILADEIAKKDKEKKDLEAKTKKLSKALDKAIKDLAKLQA